MNALHLTLRQLQIFVAIARSGSTTQASVDVALSQSATSSALNELERLLSMQLFDRAGKRLMLNDNGRALLPRALSLLDGAADIERMAAGHSLALQTLRIGASTTIGNYVLPTLLASGLQEQHAGASDWRATVKIGNTAEICDALAAFELDVGLIEGPCHEPSLDASPWLRDAMVVVAAPESPLAKVAASGATRVSPPSAELLASQVWLLREAGSGTREATDQALLPYLKSYRRSIELGSSEAIKRVVAEGTGIACLSSWVVADMLADGRLVRIETGLPPLVRQCYLVVHRAKHPTLALLSFIERANAHAGPR